MALLQGSVAGQNELTIPRGAETGGRERNSGATIRRLITVEKPEAGGWDGRGCRLETEKDRKKQKAEGGSAGGETRFFSQHTQPQGGGANMEARKNCSRPVIKKL